MGASFFRTSQRGRTLNAAYDSAVEDAVSEYGHDPYNGTISTTTEYGVIDKTKEFKNSKFTIQEFIDSYVEKGDKRQCFAVCLEEPKVNSNKIKSKVEHVVSPGTKKWVLKYTVYCYDIKLGSFSTKGDAVKSARAHTEKSLQSTEIVMEKVLEKGSTTVAKVVYKRSVNEIHGRWVFFGWAAE